LYEFALRSLRLSWRPLRSKAFNRRVRKELAKGAKKFLKDTTMKCNEIRELLPDLAAGLSAPAGEVNDHLRACTGCAATLNEFRQTMALLDEWQAPEPSPYFDVRLRARLREEAAKQPQSWFGWLRRPALAISLGLALIVGTTLVLQHDAVRRNKDQGPIATLTGTAVGDLQTLDKDHDMLSDSDPDSAASLLDDLQVQQDVNANP
jgi:predicted anti-sigma-YlaC factor YlaD